MKTAALPPVPQYRGLQTTSAVHVFNFLESDAAAARMDRMRIAEWRKPFKALSQPSLALSAAYHALQEKAADSLLAVQARGHLLYCWHGTQFIAPPHQQPQPEPKPAAWPFPPSGGPTAWTGQQVQAHAAQQRETLGEALL